MFVFFLNPFWLFALFSFSKPVKIKGLVFFRQILFFFTKKSFCDASFFLCNLTVFAKKVVLV